MKDVYQLNAGLKDETKRIYINNDRIPKEREQFKKLREEKNRRTDNDKQILSSEGGRS